MLKTRIIPCLLLHEGGLVKTEKFKDPKYVGDPINAVRIYNEKEVDELIFLDIDASRKGEEPNLSTIEDLATECFMPFAYGGGITTLQQIQRILKIGVEKVILNHSALKNPDFVKEAAKHFGNSTIIVAVDIKKDLWGNYKVYDHVKKKTVAQSPTEYALKMCEAGAGELFINNVDRDGTYSGFDWHILESINKIVSVPVIACGGTSGVKDLKEVVAKANVSGVAAGSIFVYQGPHRAVLISYPSQDELQQLFS
ncbi:MAG TPA: AglZ/HisF2 family acetamidino modification protein [Chryseolinea sp.]|nr:AglZ/HisF2 family acetamidino modification protein [Chryseolinea sp.]